MGYIFVQKSPQLVDFQPIILLKMLGYMINFSYLYYIKKEKI